MRFTIKLVIGDGDEPETVEEIIQLEKDAENCNSLGISLIESRKIMKILQNKIVLQQSNIHMFMVDPLRVGMVSEREKRKHERDKQTPVLLYEDKKSIIYDTTYRYSTFNKVMPKKFNECEAKEAISSPKPKK